MNRLKCATILTLLLAMSANAFGDVNACSNSVATNPKTLKAVQFLRSISGSYPLGDCTVELHVCSTFAADDSPGPMVADLLVRDGQGREQYIPLEFPETKTSGLQTTVQNGRIMLHYESDNRMGSEEMGHLESVRLEFLTSRDHQNLVSLEEGWYSTKDWKERRKGSVYRWILCHGSAPLRADASPNLGPNENLPQTPKDEMANEEAAPPSSPDAKESLQVLMNDFKLPEIDMSQFIFNPIYRFQP